MTRRDIRRIIKLVPYEYALQKMLEARIVRPSFCEVSLDKALGRTLAEDVTSQVNIPGESRAIFDGYAVSSRDVQEASMQNPVTLRVIGRAFPNEGRYRIMSGEAFYVACGSILPEGADAVVKVENVRLRSEEIELPFPIEAGENVSVPGEDVAIGSAVLKAGHPVRPQDIGLLAGIGVNRVKVFKKPRIGIISVGDELIEIAKRNPERVANNYALVISQLVKEFGGSPMILGIVPDDLNQIKESLAKAARNVEIITTIAGCSVGQKDFVPDAINALEKPGIVIHGVKISPGKVMGWGIVNDKPIVMLPGHIVAACAAFYLLVIPLIARHRGLEAESLLYAVNAEITDDLKERPTATFLRVSLFYDKGTLKAKPVHGGSGVLSTLTKSNGYVVIPPKKSVPKGTKLEVILFTKLELDHIVHME